MNRNTPDYIGRREIGRIKLKTYQAKRLGNYLLIIKEVKETPATRMTQNGVPILEDGRNAENQKYLQK